MNNKKIFELRDKIFDILVEDFKSFSQEEKMKLFYKLVKSSRDEKLTLKILNKISIAATGKEFQITEKGIH